MLYAVYGFIFGLGVGLVIFKKCTDDAKREIKRINKSWRTELDNKNEVIESLQKQLERRN